MECPVVDSVPLRLTEELKRENIITLSLYEINKYLQQKPGEIIESLAYNQSIVLATVAGDMKFVDNGCFAGRGQLRGCGFHTPPLSV